MENQKMMMMLKLFLSLNCGSNFLYQEMYQSFAAVFWKKSCKQIVFTL